MFHSTVSVLRLRAKGSSGRGEEVCDMRTMRPGAACVFMKSELEVVANLIYSDIGLAVVAIS